ncbi:hypothetical protein ACFXTN_019974 [Malus domestica]
MGPGPGHMGNWMEPHAARPASSFGASSTAKSSVADHGRELGAGTGEPSPIPRVLLELEEDVQNDVIEKLREQGSGHQITNAGLPDPVMLACCEGLGESEFGVAGEEGFTDEIFENDVIEIAVVIHRGHDVEGR